jgi:hypothetical protein
MRRALFEQLDQPALGVKLPERIDGIILLLGGAVNQAPSLSSGETTFNCSTARVLRAVALARRHPEAKLVLVGGEGGLFPVGHSDARDPGVCCRSRDHARAHPSGGEVA